ncbi:MAG TPA: ABC transporter [Lachnoclostridium sp.]|nr:ABC transporter [Lachnoclostridium sp.]
MAVVKTLLKSVRQYKKQSLLSPLFVAGEVVLECMIPLVMSKLIDHLSADTMTPILQYGLVLLVMATMSLGCGVLAARNAAEASCGFAKNLRQDMYFKIQDFAFADIDKFSASSLVTRMTTDVTNVQNAYQLLIRLAVRTPLMIIFSVIMAMTINVKMALIFLCILPILAGVLFGIATHVHPIFKRIFKKYDALNNSVQENVAGIRVVKSFVRESYETEKFNQAAEEVRKDFTFVEKILAFNNPTMMFCMYLSMFLVYYIGAQMIVNSGATELTTGQLSSLISYGVQILASVMMLSMVFIMTTMASECAERIAEVLNHESSLTSPENGATEVADGSVDFDHVSFKYSEKSKKFALSDIDLHIPSGATVGIIGGTGSSKTSLIQLISRLYDVSEGSVKVAGKDVREYDLESLRDAVAVVLQKNVLFSGTIYDNIRWGNENASDEEVQNVCKLAQADGFVREFPDGYNTQIVQGGNNVSGGQKQRLCIARALLKKPKILILDDSTSAVDTKTDALIRKAFREEIPNTTKIIIAQRVSSIEDADQIIVLENGAISGIGTSEELLKTNDIYREVYESQVKGGEDHE